MQIEEFRGLADELRAQEKKVREAEFELERAKERMRQLQEEVIPEAMLELDLSDFSLGDGFGIKLEDRVRASLPKDARAAALDYIEELGHGASVKRTVTVAFGKGQGDQASAAAKLLMEQGLRPTTKRDIHPSTLTALVKKRLEDGLEVDETKLNLFHRTVAKITTA